MGERPIAQLKRGYEWTYLYGFVRPTTKELFSLALGEFAKEFGAGEDKHIVLVVDRAGWHTSGEVSSFPKVYTLSCCPRALRSLCPRRGCGP